MSQSKRHLARRLCLQALYQWDLTGQAPEAIEEHFLNDAPPSRYDVAYFKRLITGVPAHYEQLDQALREHLDRAVGSVDLVERAVLRLAAWEMLFEDDIPPGVTIDEAVELAKVYGSDQGFKFVNGVLDKLRLHLEAHAAPPLAPNHVGEQASDKVELGEFDIIERFFKPMAGRINDQSVLLGIGDDAAVITPPKGQHLAVTTDTMVSGVHFLPDQSPVDLGHKLLAVNLSDLAAMGAKPGFATLALTMPSVDEAWLTGFSEGLLSIAEQFSVTLVGGDTTRGDLTLTVQLCGWVPERGALSRAGAKVGDGIYVTGTLGDAALGLKALLGEFDAGPHAEALQARLHRPTPRVETGLALRGFASAAIDVSDGLVQDLTHILTASKVGATLNLDVLPLSPMYRELLPTAGLRPVLSGGDDYELLFTLPPARADRLPDNLQITRIGSIEKEPGLRVISETMHGDGPQRLDLEVDQASASSGFQHFGKSSNNSTK